MVVPSMIDLSMGTAASRLAAFRIPVIHRRACAVGSATLRLLLSLVLLFTVLPAPLGHAETKSAGKVLGSLQLKDATIQINRGVDDRIQLVVSGTKIPTPDIFEIESPNRLVVDYPITGLRANRSLPIKIAGSLQTVRIAGHADKLRVVLDFGDSKIPPYLLTEDGERSIVAVGDADQRAPQEIVVQRIVPSASPVATPALSTAAAPPTRTSATGIVATAVPAREGTTKGSVPPQETAQEKPTLAPTSTPTKVPATVRATSTPTAQATPTTAVTPSPPPTLTASPTPASTTKPGVQQLQGIIFQLEETSRDPIIVLKMTERPAFRVSKKDERTFRISITGAALSRNSLSLPHYPPGDFAGFTMAIAAPNRDGIEVIISVDRGRRVTAVPRLNDIIVKSSVR
jgi:hypothetical protein